MHNKKQIILLTILLLTLAYFPLFQHLATLPIRLWDESRQAFNVIEMQQNQNYMVTHFEGRPEMWNTKPPLLIWLQLMFVKLLGFGELALRLPSAIAGLLTCLLLFYTGVKHFQKPLFGFASAVILISMNGYISYHVTRTGDYDALLVLFDLLLVIAFFLYLQTERTKYMYLTFTAIILATLTKGPAGLMMVPGLFIVSVVFKKLKTVLLDKHFYLGISLFIVCIGGYYLGRESMNPGYMEAVWNNELGGRFAKGIEGHEGPANFYLLLFNDGLAGYFYYFLIPAIACIFFYPKGRQRNFLLTSLIVSVSFLLIISFSKTKLQWYAAPLLPFIAILNGGLVSFVADLVMKQEILSAGKKYTIVTLMISAFIYSGYRIQAVKTYKEKEGDFMKDYRLSYYLRDVYNGKEKLNEPLGLYYDGFPYHLSVYTLALNQKGYDVNLVNDGSIRQGMLVALSQNQMEDRLRSLRPVELVRETDMLRIYRVR